VGRLPEPPIILDRICRLLPPSGPLTGVTITITAGPTQETIDPVRVISNFSSGRMGFALAEEARRRGATVHLISGPGSLPEPPGISVVHVTNTEEMREAVAEHFEDSRVLIMAAAPSDFRARNILQQKLRKESVGQVSTLEIEKTTDILMDLAAKKGNRLILGFALETEQGVDNARRKLREKNLDLIVLNHPNPGGDAGPGKQAIEGTIITAEDEEVLPLMPKEAMARVILDRLQKLLIGPEFAQNSE